MSVQSTAAKTFMGEMGAFFSRMGTLAKELFTGEWVTRASWSAKTGINESVFRNGIKVVETPGKGVVASIPMAWMQDDASRLTLTQVRHGSWTTRTHHSFETGITEKTLANGIRIVEKPGEKAAVQLPSRILAKAGIKI